MAAYQLDPRVELGSRARDGHGPQRVLEAIGALGGRASQAQLAGILGVIPGTVGRHCHILEARGELVRGGLDKATSGRGSQVWKLPPRDSFHRPGGLRLGLSPSPSSNSTIRTSKRSSATAKALQ
jgi:hypothetical protein